MFYPHNARMVLNFTARFIALTNVFNRDKKIGTWFFLYFKRLNQKKVSKCGSDQSDDVWYSGWSTRPYRIIFTFFPAVISDSVPIPIYTLHTLQAAKLHGSRAFMSAALDLLLNDARVVSD